MNKQELITRIEKIEYENLRYNSPERMLLEQKHKILDLVEQLDEPQKPVVPKFLDEYMKENEGKHAADIFSTEWLYEEPNVLEEKVAKWLLNDETEENNRRYLIAVQAFVTGDYEVEKEPLYEVIIGNLFLVKKFNNRNDSCFVNKFELCWWEKSAYQLTEPEIKAIDERYWPFAVPVEEVAEG